MRKLIVSVTLTVACLTTAMAQERDASKPSTHFDLGVTLGTTGIGIDASMPIGDMVKVRTGFEYMPRFNYNMHFDVESFDAKGIPSTTTLSLMSETLYNLTGFKVDQKVTMKGKPTMWNFKLLVDFYPLKNNKHWHVTAGFHWGPSKIAEAVNAIEDSPSLFAVGMYNHLYDVAYKDWILDIPTPLITTETTGELYIDPNIEKQIINMGRMGIPMGKYKDGSGNYYMEPNENSMVYANAYANSFKPYLGFGYEGRLIKNNDNYKIGFDAGVMFWGGAPSIITHDGTNLAKDVEEINGKVGTYVDLVKAFKVFPVLNLRITRTIF